MVVYSASQGLAEYVGVAGGGIASAAQGAKQTFTQLASDNPLMLAGGIAVFALLFLLTRSHGR